MTIREYLDRRERPYKRNVILCLVIFIVGGAAMVSIPVETSGTALAEGRLGWRFGALLISGSLYLAGGVGLMAATVFQVFRIRCPHCNGRLRSRTKHWNYCPLCGVHFGTQVPDIAQKGSSQQTTPADAVKSGR